MHKSSKSASLAADSHRKTRKAVQQLNTGSADTFYELGFIFVVKLPRYLRHLFLSWSMESGLTLLLPIRGHHILGMLLLACDQGTKTRENAAVAHSQDY